MSNETLKCSTCQQDLPLDAFGKNRHNVNRGYKSYVCRKCNTKSSSDWVKKNRGYEVRELKHCAPDNVELSSTDLAWIAGFTDAEGSLFMSSGEHPFPRVTHSNTVLSSLKFIQSKMGGYLSKGKERKSRPNSRPEYALQFSNEKNVLNFCEKIMPYMTIKKKHAELFCSALRIDQGKRHSKARTEALLAASTIVEKWNERGNGRIQEEEIGCARFDGATAEEFAYLAGYVEGDGSLDIEMANDAVNFYPRIKVYGTKIESLKYLHGIFGGYISIGEKYSPDGKRWSDRAILLIKDSASVQSILYYMTRFLKFKIVEAELQLFAFAFDSKERRIFADAIRAIRGMEPEEAQKVAESMGINWDEMYGDLGVSYETDEEAAELDAWRAKKEYQRSEQERLDRGDLYPHEQHWLDQNMLNDASVSEEIKAEVRKRMEDRLKTMDDEEKRLANA